MGSWCVRALIAASLAMVAWTTHGEATVTERDDGTVALAAGERQFVVPAAIAETVATAVRDLADDPAELRSALAKIIEECADCQTDASQVEAVVALAVFHARGRSSSIDAILRAAAASQTVVSGAALLTLLPALQGATPPGDAAREELAQLQATAENPSQISPVQ